MSDKLALIEKVIEEHRSIGRQMKLVGESVTDEEALASLEKARADLIPGKPDAASVKHGRLLQAVGYLDEGLRNHFAFEEQVFPEMLGDLLARAIVLQHEEIRRELEETRVAAAGTWPDGPGREEALAEELRLQQKVGTLAELVSDHARKEEVILDMARLALEEGR
jgi:hypothetical protein